MGLPARTDLAQRAALVSVVSTVAVVGLKLTAAGVSGSVAVLAEALQSTLDVAVSLAALYAIRLAAKPADADHPYGHGNAELLLSALQMVLVILSAGVIAWQAALRFHDPRPIRPDWGMAAMAYAAVANTAVSLYLRKVARATGSAALDGEATHLIGDTFSSLGVLGGLLAYVLTNWKPIDPLVAILFTVLSAALAFRKLRKLLHPLMGGSLPKEDLKAIEGLLQSHAETRGYHNVRTGQTGSLRIVSLHVLLDDHLSFVAAHDTAEQMEKELSEALGGALVTIHYEPYEAETEHRLREHPV